MLTPVAVNAPRHLNPTAPACQPCPWPALLQLPMPQPYNNVYHITDYLGAAKRCAEVAKERPTWPRSRVRGLVARELNVSTVTLRYLLGKAATLTKDEQPTPSADAPSLAA